jgi:hypothetical protein
VHDYLFLSRTQKAAAAQFLKNAQTNNTNNKIEKSSTKINLLNCEYDLLGTQSAHHHGRPTLSLAVFVLQ